MSELSPEIIRGQRFRKRFRGLDPKAVESFLDELADEFDRLLAENRALRFELKDTSGKLNEVSREKMRLEGLLPEAREQARRIEEQAQKQADFLISKAELTAEKMLNNTHKRLAQLHEDLAELKRQRTHLEIKLRSFIEAHLKLLDLEQENQREAEELEGKIRFLNKT